MITILILFPGKILQINLIVYLRAAVIFYRTGEKEFISGYSVAAWPSNFVLSHLVIGLISRMKINDFRLAIYKNT